MAAITTIVIHVIMTIMTFPDRAPMVTDMQHEISITYMYMSFSLTCDMFYDINDLILCLCVIAHCFFTRLNLKKMGPL